MPARSVTKSLPGHREPSHLRLPPYPQLSGSWPRPGRSIGTAGPRPACTQLRL